MSKQTFTISVPADYRNYTDFKVKAASEDEAYQKLRIHFDRHAGHPDVTMGTVDTPVFQEYDAEESWEVIEGDAEDA